MLGILLEVKCGPLEGRARIDTYMPSQKNCNKIAHTKYPRTQVFGYMDLRVGGVEADDRLLGSGGSHNRWYFRFESLIGSRNQRPGKTLNLP